MDWDGLALLTLKEQFSAMKSTVNWQNFGPRYLLLFGRVAALAHRRIRWRLEMVKRISKLAAAGSLRNDSRLVRQKLF